MIKSFSSETTSINDFITKVSTSLAERELGKIASMTIADQQVVVTFSKLGKSEVTFELANLKNGFKCTYKSEKIALVHRPLRGDIESKLAKVLESNGAQVQEG